MSAKLHEAQEHCKAADKFLKTSLLKWKPDFDSAADEYSQAAQCYRIARDLQKSKECYLKASELYKKNRSFFHAGKAIENAIIVSKELTPPEELYSLGCESSSLYQQHGSGDSGANILDKVAKIIEERAPELAVKLYQQAADVSSSESGQHQGSEYISKSSRILVKLQRYDEAVDSLRREIGFHQEAGNISAVGRLTVAIVLVQLARGDAVAAEKAYKEWGNNCEVPEIQTLEQLLQAYDEEDRDSAKKALASPFIRSMDVEYARLASTIPLPEGLEPVPKASVRENAAPSYVSQNAAYVDNEGFVQTYDITMEYDMGQLKLKINDGKLLRINTSDLLKRQMQENNAEGSFKITTQYKPDIEYVEKKSEDEDELC